jgi:hypothetical protein
MCMLQHEQTAKHRPRSSLCWPPIMHHSRPKHPLNTDQPTNVTGVVQRRRADMHQPDQIVSIFHAPGGVAHVCIPQLPCGTTHQSRYTVFDMFFGFSQLPFPRGTAVGLPMGHHDLQYQRFDHISDFRCCLRHLCKTAML